jgi:hypothetical protein
VLTSEPMQSDKSQYSINFLEALGTLNRKIFHLSVIYFDRHWYKYRPSAADNITLYNCDVNIHARTIRKAVLQ